MRQTPVNLESAIELLREEYPSESTRLRTSSYLKRPSQRKRTLLPGLAGAAVVLATVTILWPRSVDASWQKAVEQTNRATNLHRVARSRGVVLYEMWRQGDKESIYSRAPSGGLATELRFDGRRLYSFYDRDLFDSRRNANRFRFATTSTIKGKWVANQGTRDLVSDLLSRGQVTLVDQKRVTTADGDRIQYHVRFDEGSASIATVLAEPDSGRIRKIDSLGMVSETDYPTTVDPAVFEPHAQLAKDVKVLDIPTERADVEQMLSHPMVGADGIKLRAVLLDSDGILWVLWTGYAPDGKMSRPFSVPGIESGPAFGPSAFTARFDKDKGSLPAPRLGLRLNGMGREPKVRVGDHLDLRIPNRNGWSLFRNAPVYRISRLQDLAVELGMRPKGAMD